MTLRRRLVYTCVFSGYDDLRPPRCSSQDVAFVCITDDPALRVPGWDVRLLDASAEGIRDLDASRQSRYAKILPHKLFANYDASLYVDANLELIGSVEPLFAELATHDVVFFRHPENRPDIYAEADACIALGKDDPERIKEQVDRYRVAGFDGKSAPRFETIPAGMIILRNHCKVSVRKTMELWWQEYLNGSRRDQISLPFALRTAAQPHVLLEVNARNNEHVEWRPHDSIQAVRAARRWYAGADALVLHFESLNLDRLEQAVCVAREATHGPLTKLHRILNQSLRRRRLDRELVFAPVPSHRSLLRLRSGDWGKALGISGRPIAYVYAERTGSDSMGDDSRLLEILHGHDAPFVAVTINDLWAGRTESFLDWCDRAGISIDGDVLVRMLGETDDRRRDQQT